MARTLGNLESGYRQKGWKETIEPDGAISFERDARPSVMNRKRASLARYYLDIASRQQIAPRDGQRIIKIRKHSLGQRGS
jgi:hypothetical protein